MVRQWVRRAFSGALIVSLIGLAAAGSAVADTRTATLTDGPDPGAAFDVASLHAETNRDAGTVTLSATFVSPIPNPVPFGSYMVVWLSDADVNSCPDAAGKVGDVYMNIEPSTTAPGNGALEASTNVKFRQEYTTVPVTLSPDRMSLSLSLSDDLLKQSNHRCMTGFTYGQGSYDPSQPGGGATGDTLGSVWFDGQAPGSPGAPMQPCTGPMLKLSGPTRVAWGSSGLVRVSETTNINTYQGGAKLVMADKDTGKAFYTHEFDGNDDNDLGDFEDLDFFINLDPERRPAVVTLTWPQIQLDDNSTVNCTATQDVASTRGSRPSFYAVGGGSGELIPHGKRCWETRGLTVRVTLSAGGRSAHFVRRDACNVFSGHSRTINNVHVQRTSYGTLLFTSYGAGRATLTVNVAGHVVMRRTVTTSVHSVPDRRIYEGTDAFVNYCINHNRQIYSYRLQLYCIKPGSYSEGVRFRR